MGSEGSAAGGRYSDPSEWQRSIADEAALTARKISGTATGGTPARNDKHYTMRCITHVIPRERSDRGNP